MAPRNPQVEGRASPAKSTPEYLVLPSRPRMSLTIIDKERRDVHGPEDYHHGRSEWVHSGGSPIFGKLVGHLTE